MRTTEVPLLCLCWKTWLMLDALGEAGMGGSPQIGLIMTCLCYVIPLLFTLIACCMLKEQLLLSNRPVPDHSAWIRRSPYKNAESAGRVRSE